MFAGKVKLIAMAGKVSLVILRLCYYRPMWLCFTKMLPLLMYSLKHACEHLIRYLGLYRDSGQMKGVALADYLRFADVLRYVLHKLDLLPNGCFGISY